MLAMLRVLFIGFVLLRRAALGSGLWYHSRQTPRLVTGVFGSIFHCSVPHVRFQFSIVLYFYCPLKKKNILVKVWPQQDFMSSDGRRGLIGLSRDIGAATLGTAGYSQIPTRRARHDFHSANFCQPFTLYIHLVATAVFHSTIGFVTHNQPSDCLFQYITDCLTLSSGPLFHSDINSSQGWFAHECLVPDAELSLIDEQGKDTAGKLILTLISVVSHCLALQRVS